mgnify:CR=1 FL=1
MQLIQEMTNETNVFQEKVTELIGVCGKLMEHVDESRETAKKQATEIENLKRKLDDVTAELQEVKRSKAGQTGETENLEQGPGGPQGPQGGADGLPRRSERATKKSQFLNSEVWQM